MGPQDLTDLFHGFEDAYTAYYYGTLGSHGSETLILKMSIRNIRTRLRGLTGFEQ